MKHYNIVRKAMQVTEKIYDVLWWNKNVPNSWSHGTPHYNRASWFEVGKGYFRKARRCPLGGSGFAAAMALWAACSGLQIQESKQKNSWSHGLL